MLDKETENEVTNFLIMCNDYDRNFLMMPPKDRKTDDYIRLMCIARVLGFKRVVIRLIIETANCEEEIKIIKRIEELRKDDSVVIKWIDDFVEHINPPFYKKAVSEEWVKAKEQLNGKNFFDVNL